MVPIGELVEGDQVGREVYDSAGVTRVVATKANGRKRVFRARLRNGSFIEATPDHVVKAVAERRTQPAWLRMDQLEVGMRMHLHPHRAKVSDPMRVAVGAGGVRRRYWMSLTEGDRVDVAEAALAGWLQADGFVGQYDRHEPLADDRVPGRHRRRVRLGHAEPRHRFPDVHRKVREADTQHVRVRRIRLYGEVLRDFVERWGLLARGTEMRVPAQLLTASHDEIVAYLRSIFQADGYITVQPATATRAVASASP